MGLAWISLCLCVAGIFTNYFFTFKVTNFDMGLALAACSIWVISFILKK
jgi:hypothetical protein